MSKKEGVGIYGGTFSPIHFGHVRAALRFFETTPLDKLYIVPNSLPHGKSAVEGATDADRLAMIRLAFGEYDAYKDGRICVSDAEISREGKCYTADTLERFAAPDRQLYLLVGTDMFLILDKWYRAKDVFALADIVLVRRESDAANTALIEARAAEYCEQYGAHVSVIDTEPMLISSAAVRERIASGEALDGLVPDGVIGYINDNGLYRTNR